VNLYFLIFALLLVVAGAITIVNYLNSQKAPVVPNVTSQALTQEALKQLANTDTTVGGSAQTLTIQGNAVISGQTLMRGNLNVAGNFQTGGSIQGPSLTISGTSNLGTAQISTLQVAQNVAVQGTTTMRDLNVSGTSSFSGPMTASQITVTKLILSGSGTLQLPNHLSFTGPSPGRSFIGSGILGGGGSVSVNGSDTSGSINLNSGNSTSGTGCIVRVNFQTPFTIQPHVIISPVNSAAGKLDYYVERNTAGFSVCTATDVEDNKVFAFDYFVTG
jgi:cytoskeletal protein CcmA (bactofilin family)